MLVRHWGYALVLTWLYPAERQESSGTGLEHADGAERIDATRAA